MKVYLASSFSFKEKVQRTSDCLEAKGIDITRKWWFADCRTSLGEITDSEWYQHPTVHSVAEEDFRAIDEADAVVLVCPDDSPHRFNGANVEVGYSLAKQKRVLSLGTLDRSPMYVGVERCESLGDLVNHLDKVNSSFDAS